MNKYGAASLCDPGTRIVIDLNDEIVETIFSRKPVAFGVRRHLDGAVVAAVSGILAPGVGAADPACREGGAWAWMPVGAPPQPLESERAARRTSVAFTFICLDAAPAKCHWQRKNSGDQPASPPVPWLVSYCDPGQWSFLQCRCRLGFCQFRPKYQFTLALLSPNALLRDYTDSRAHPLSKGLPGRWPTNAQF